MNSPGKPSTSRAPQTQQDQGSFTQGRLLPSLVGSPTKLRSSPNGLSGAQFWTKSYSQSSVWDVSVVSWGQPPARAAHPAVLECSSPHWLLVCLESKKISVSPKLNTLQRGKLGWRNIWFWQVWGRGWQTGSEVGTWKSPQLSASEGTHWAPIAAPGAPWATSMCHVK